MLLALFFSAVEGSGHLVADRYIQELELVLDGEVGGVKLFRRI